jgi:nucleoside-diphosphate-sugar epimerase
MTILVTGATGNIGSRVIAATGCAAAQKGGPKLFGRTVFQLDEHDAVTAQSSGL